MGSGVATTAYRALTRQRAKNMCISLFIYFQPAKVQKKNKIYKFKLFYFCNLTKNKL
jgi:hypothetical protein